MRNIRPVFVFQEASVTTQQMQAVMYGISELLKLALVEQHVAGRNYGAWRHTPYQDEGGQLIPYHSVDWYIDRGLRTSTRRNQVNASAMLDCSMYEPWQNYQPHHDVFVLQQDLNSGKANNNFVIGLARPNLSTVISVHRFLGLPEPLQSGCIKTEIMHELGHVFGLIPEDRTEMVEESLGRHCTNRCLMRQGIYLPHDWIRMTKDRLAVGPLCNQCLHDLRRHFS